ncbi:MAG: ABC transporter permease [Gemmatimonadales bacterium]
MSDAVDLSRPGDARREQIARLGYLWWQLLLRDLKARYKQTVLGGIWSLGQPVMELLVYAVVFGAVLRAPSDDAPYPLFAYVGVVLWTFVAGALTRSTSSITGHAGLVSSAPFPKAAIPLAAVGAALADTMLSTILLIAALVYYQAPLTPQVAWLVPIGAILLAFVTGLALISSALNVFYRDIHHLVGLGVRLWLFLTPVVYAASAVPDRYRAVYALNPLVGVFEAVRAVLIRGEAPDPSLLVFPAAAAAAAAVGGVLLFQRTEPFFAETV